MENKIVERLMTMSQIGIDYVDRTGLVDFSTVKATNKLKII